MSMNRRDHHADPIEPRLDRARMPPSTLIGLPYRITPPPPAPAGTPRAAPASTGPPASPRRRHHPLGQLLLPLDQLVHPLLQRPGADQLADLHVLALPDPEGAVGRLLLHGRVPPAVDVHDMAGGGQVEPDAGRLERQQEQHRLAVLLEAVHEPVAGLL